MADPVVLYVRSRAEYDAQRLDVVYALETGRRVNVFIRGSGGVALAFSGLPVAPGFMVIEETGRRTGRQDSPLRVAHAGVESVEYALARHGAPRPLT